METTLRLIVDHDDPAAAGQYARELRSSILDADRDGRLDARLARVSDESMDAGTAVEIAVALTAHLTVVSVIEGIKVWWELRRIPLIIEVGDQVLVAEHASLSALERLKEELSRDVSAEDREP